MEDHSENTCEFVETDFKKLHDIAIAVDRILREEINRAGLECSFAEARVYNIKSVGVQGDQRTYGYPVKITLKEPKHADGTFYSVKELYNFLGRLSTQITNNVEDINRVVYLTKDEREKSQ